MAAWWARASTWLVADAAVVGAQVVAAIRNGTFFLPTHDEVHGIVRERGTDPEGFLAALIKERHPA
jgi:hypothetical protein